MHHHAFAVDTGYFQVGCLAYSEPRGICEHQDCPMCDILRHAKKGFDFGEVQDNGELFVSPGDTDTLYNIPFQYLLVQEFYAAVIKPERSVCQFSLVFKKKQVFLDLALAQLFRRLVEIKRFLTSLRYVLCVLV